MGAAAGLARRLRDALREEEPRAVEELLVRGADPNLVLPDGAAALHLAAGARHPRGLRCLGVLLGRGGDPNVRSAEALTPLHVAAAWGCRRGLELLLSQGADPELRDQDGLRPLDLAVQQGHSDCARLLRELRPQPLSRRHPERRLCLHFSVSHGCASDPDPPPAGAPGPRALQTPPGGAASGGNTGPGPPGLRRALQVSDPEGRSGSPPGSGDSCSDASFVTAVEAAPDPSPRVGPPPPAPSSPGPPRDVFADGDLGLCVPMRALALSSLACSPLPPGAPERPRPAGDQAALDSATAALWLTEDEASTTGCADPVPAGSDPELLRTPERPGPTAPGLPRQREAHAVPGPAFPGRSPELAEALRTGRIPDARADEDALIRQFERPDPASRWREGVLKSSFTYLLLDPRETQNLPDRAASLTPAQRLRVFVRAVFYVGKGTRARPNAHLWEALGHRGRPGRQACPKVRHILDIWASGRGVVSLHCFQHVVAVEAYTREACLVDALGIQTLTNQKQGHCYGVVAGWPAARRRRLGVHLLHRALLVFLAEGQRELRPQDIQARG
ncbi:ankyrin repeat and LEM domain-containing protein 1 [Lepus europaeus]|uniref:ankyrin repeat and LEM domain-containing protein 1 n=1 Tax=Lepus europaeus TaxID=9983 RepID=UPI002B45C41B|nr:ankyrin repeat and LEM domain-containing protein 1 [Lepus europaeus]